MPWTEIKIILITFAMTLLSGWALLSLTSYWQSYFTSRKIRNGTMISNLSSEQLPYLRMETAE